MKTKKNQKNKIFYYRSFIVGGIGTYYKNSMTNLSPQCCLIFCLKIYFIFLYTPRDNITVNRKDSRPRSRKIRKKEKKNVFIFF